MRVRIRRFRGLRLTDTYAWHSEFIEVAHRESSLERSMRGHPQPAVASARAADLRGLTLDRESFAVTCPLALVGHALYPVPVRRPAALATASFSDSLTLTALRFARVVAINFPKVFHLQVSAHAGHTRNAGTGSRPCPQNLTSCALQEFAALLERVPERELHLIIITRRVGV